MIRPFILLLLLPTLASADIAPFRAEYAAKFKGLPVRATGIRELVQTQGSDYRFSSSAKSLIAEVAEVSLLSLDGQMLKPSLYEYTRKGMGKNKAESTQFDWTASIAHHDGTSSELQPATFDKLSYQLQLKTDVENAYLTGNHEQTFEYLVADEEKRKLYTFEIVGEETLSTPLGDIHTVRLDRIRNDKPRHTSLWLAIDYDFLLIRLIQTEDNKGFELNIQSALVDGEPLTSETRSLGE